MGTGKLQFQLSYADGAYPVSDAEIVIIDTEVGTPIVDGPIKLDSSGKSELISLYTVDKVFSQVPNPFVVPYKTYDAIISSNNFKNVIIKNIQIFDGVTSLENVSMIPKTKGLGNSENIILTEHGLLQNIPVIEDNSPKKNGIAPLLLEKPVVPQYITVHLGTPSSNASNVNVSFTDYIKNVASSEIYPTWPENAIRANIYAQISFTLNRIYTEWYRSRGYNFDITNSTAYDHYFVNGRDIFDNISIIVDDIFNDYISRKTFLEPLLAQYCNGTTVTCDGLSQWGTVDYANQGLSPFQILSKYYGNNIELRTGTLVEGVSESYPGTSLKLGSTGADVKTIQNQLNRIRKNYPGIPEINPVDGVFNKVTEDAVKSFQKIFNLTADGIVGKSSWYKISQIYVGVKNLAELESEGEKLPIPETAPNTVIKRGSTGIAVKVAQFFLACIAAFYDNVPSVKITGNFDEATENSVKAFQKKFNLSIDGIIGPKTWEKLYEIYLTVEPYIFTESGKMPTYPGYLLKEGSRGDDVKTIQGWLNEIAKAYPQISKLSVDGIFGSGTKASVIAFQKLFGLSPDGIVGPLTWNKMYEIFIQVKQGGTNGGGSGGSTGGGSGSGSGSGSGDSIPYPGYLLKVGSKGDDVKTIQKWLNSIAKSYPQISKLSIDGIFGSGTKASVIAFQNLFGLSPDGIVGNLTWDKLYKVYKDTL